MALVQPPEIAPELVEAVKLIPSSHNQALPPGWRWERASWLLSAGRRYRRKVDDKWVSLAMEFQQDMVRATTMVAVERLQHKFPGLYKAWELANDTNKSSRWSIEAYLCADASIDHISQRTCEHKETILCFTNVFFDVRNKQKHRLYMLNKVIGPSVHHGLTDRQYDVLWKLFGLLKGPMFLDRYIYGEESPTQMTSYDQGGPLSRELMRTMADNKALATMRVIQANVYNQEVILNTYNKLLEIEKSSGGTTGGGSSDGVHSLLMNNINKMICNFNFAIDGNNQPTEIRHWDENGIELRTDELIARSLGQPVPEKPIPVLAFPAEAATPLRKLNEGE